MRQSLLTKEAHKSGWTPFALVEGQYEYAWRLLGSFIRAPLLGNTHTGLMITVCAPKSEAECGATTQGLRYAKAGSKQSPAVFVESSRVARCR